MDIKKLLESYNEFLFTDGYIIDQQLGVIDESAIADFLALDEVKIFDTLPIVIGNEAECKYKESCGHDYCNLDECPEYEAKTSEVAVCEHPRSERMYIGENMLKCCICGAEFK